MYILTNDTDKEQYCGRHNKQPRPPCPSIPSRQEHCNWSLAPLVPTDHDDTLTTCLSIPVVATVRALVVGYKSTCWYTRLAYLFSATLWDYTHTGCKVRDTSSQEGRHTHVNLIAKSSFKLKFFPNSPLHKVTSSMAPSTLCWSVVGRFRRMWMGNAN